MKARSLTLLVLATSLAAPLLPTSFARSEHPGRALTTSGNAAEIPPKSLKNRYGIEMIYIPPGQFMMGPAGTDIENRVHRVRIGYGFYMSRYEITQAQWQAAVGTLPTDPEFRGDNLPVDNAKFEDAVNFISKLNTLNDGYNYRLPSEAEWEYTCRAGTTEDAYGDVDKIAWYEANSGEKTHPVGGKLPNAFGLYDMLGNVWEWCGDSWHDTYKGAPTDGSMWIKDGGRSNLRGVFRGGHWNDDFLYATLRLEPTLDTIDAGVRLVAVAQTAVRPH